MTLVTYYIESFVDEGEAPQWLAQHLLDLVAAQGWEAVSDVTYVRVVPEMIPDPPGKLKVRCLVTVAEFDFDIEL